MLNGPPEPKKHFFWPKKFAFLGHFWAKNGRLLDKEWPFSGGGGALHHPFSGSLILQHMFFLVKHLQNRVGGRQTDHPSPKNTVFGPKLAFLVLHATYDADFKGSRGNAHELFPVLALCEHF